MGVFMNGIIVKNGENIEKALKRFQKVCDRAGVLKDLKNYRTYEKPSEEKKRVRDAAIRKAELQKKLKNKTSQRSHKRKNAKNSRDS